MEITQTLETAIIKPTISETKKDDKIEKNLLKNDKKQQKKVEKDDSIKLELSQDGIEEAKTIDFFASEENLEKLKSFKNAEMYGTAQANIPASTVINLLV